MDAAVPVAAGAVVGAALLASGLNVTTSMGVGAVTSAALMGVKQMLTATPPPVEEKPKKKTGKKVFVKKPEPESEEEEVEVGLSKGQKRRLADKAKKERAAQQALAKAAADLKAKEEAAKVAKAAKKKGKKGKTSAAAAPAVDATVAVVAEPETGSKKKKKKKKKAVVVEKLPTPEPSSEEEEEQEEFGDWKQTKKQSRLAERSKKGAEKAAQKKLAAEEALLAPQAVVVPCPSKEHGVIIGSKGSTLALLEEGTNTKINMPKRDSGTQYITVTGTDAGVAKVKRAIAQLIETGISDITHPDTVSNSMFVEKKFFGLLIGPGGANIKSIQDKLGVKVNLPDKNGDSTIVSLVGSDDGVEKAKACIRALIEDGFSNLTHEGYVKVQVVFPQSHLKHLIGPKGSTVQSLQADTKTRINIPSKDDRAGEYSTTVVITVVGPAEGVQACQLEMQRLAAIVEQDMTPILLAPSPEWGGGGGDMSAQNEW